MRHITQERRAIVPMVSPRRKFKAMSAQISLMSLEAWRFHGTNGIGDE
jgi:hypothetical protein